jgi:hypothetical protein
VRLTVLFLIVFAGLFLRVDSAWKGTDENLPDSQAYERIAVGLADHGVYEQRGSAIPPETQSASNYAPGLPLFVGAVFAIAGSDSARTARILLALIASLAIPLAFLLGRRLAGDGAGLAGAALVAFYPTLIGDSGMILTESLAGTLLIAAVLALLVAREGSRASLWVLSGALFGLTAMVRPEYLGILAVVALVSWLVKKPGSLSRGVMGPAALLVGALLILTPWTARNLFDEGRLIPLTTGGGQTLFAGSFLPSGGDPQKVLPALFESRPELLDSPKVRAFGNPSAVPPEIAFEVLAARDMPGLETDVALTRMGRSQYLDALTGKPLELAAFLGNKAHRIWWRGRASLTDNLPGKLFHWAVAALSLIGLAVMFARRRFDAILVGSIFIAATAVGVILIASPRRALVLWPLVSSFAGVGAALTVTFLAGLLSDRGRPVALP